MGPWVCQIGRFTPSPVPPIRLNSTAVDLEERTIEDVADRCEECGAKLTPAEMQAVMESGGPALCSIHAAEDEPGLAADEAGFTEPE